MTPTVLPLILAMALGVFAFARRRPSRDHSALVAPARAPAKDDALMRAVLQPVGDAVITITRDNRIGWMNPAAERITGWSAGEAANRPLCEIVVLTDMDTGAAPIPRDGAGLCHLVTRNGAVFAVECVFTPLAGDAPGGAGAVLVLRDLTEQRRLTLAMRDSAHQFADASARLAALFRHSVDAMMVARIGAGGQFIYEAVNPVWEGLNGIKEQDALGRTPSDCLPESVASVVLANWRRCVRERAPVSYELNVERTGAQVWEAVAAPVIAPDGSVERLIVTVRDMTSRRNLEASVRHMQRSDAIGRLTAGVAHDFNNLLQAILGALDLLAVNESLDAEAMEFVAMAEGAAERGATLVHRLLAFSRRQSLDPVLLHAEEVFTELGVLVGSTLGSRILVETAVAPGTWPVRADSVQLENCLVSLTLNARDAMPKGGRLTLSAANADAALAQEAGLAPGDYVRFTITDTGTGMTAEVAAQALEPFFTTKPVGTGTGLGLSMVHGFVQQSGGDVRLVSAPQMGTAVTLWLPRADDDAVLVPPEPSAGPAAPSDRLRVLLVDDDASVCRTLGMLLAKAGMEPIERGTGELALGYLRGGGACDLLISDQSMPGLSGRQLIEQAAMLRPDLPAILITGQDMVSGLEALADGVTVLRKPIRHSVFVEQVRALVRARRPIPDGGLDGGGFLAI
jgi:PAS domain S-box-containing protein